MGSAGRGVGRNILHGGVGKVKGDVGKYKGRWGKCGERCREVC